MNRPAGVHKGITYGRGRKPTNPPPRSKPAATAIPQPGEWERYHSGWAEFNHGERVYPEATVTDNPVTHTLYGPKGETIRTWTERPPVGFKRP